MYQTILWQLTHTPSPKNYNIHTFKTNYIHLFYTFKANYLSYKYLSYMYVCHRISVRETFCYSFLIYLKNILTFENLYIDMNIILQDSSIFLFSLTCFFVLYCFLCLTPFFRYSIYIKCLKIVSMAQKFSKFKCMYDVSV